MKGQSFAKYMIQIHLDKTKKIVVSWKFIRFSGESGAVKIAAERVFE